MWQWYTWALSVSLLLLGSSGWWVGWHFAGLWVVAACLLAYIVALSRTIVGRMDATFCGTSKQRGSVNDWNNLKHNSTYIALHRWLHVCVYIIILYIYIYIRNYSHTCVYLWTDVTYWQNMIPYMDCDWRHLEQSGCIIAVPVSQVKFRGKVSASVWLPLDCLIDEGHAVC